MYIVEAALGDDWDKDADYNLRGRRCRRHQCGQPDLAMSQGNRQPGHWPAAAAQAAARLGTDQRAGSSSAWCWPGSGTASPRRRRCGLDMCPS